MILFSATGGFMDSEIHTEIPEDAVEISTEEHEALLNGQSAGKQITSDAGGRPILVDPPPPDKSALAEGIRQDREQRLSRIYGPAIQQLSRWIDEAEDNPAAQIHYKTQRTAWHKWADALCDLPDQDGFPWAEGDTPWPAQPPRPTRYS